MSEVHDRVYKNPIFEGFLTDKYSEDIEDLSLNQKADLILYYTYCTTRAIRLVYGLMAVWSVGIVGYLLYNFLFGE